MAVLNDSHYGAFDLILMDVQMPGMDGFKATEAIRVKEKGSGQHLPILAMTANAMRGDREKCLEAGMDGYVSKPIMGEELFQEIDRLLPARPDGEKMGKVRSDGNLIDMKKLLAHLDGNSQLLGELATLFIQEYPKMLAHIREAIGENDGAELQRAAHQMKGAVGIFRHDSSVRMAERLESFGGSRDFAGAAKELELLEEQLEILLPELKTVGAGTSPDSPMLDTSPA